MKFCIQVPMLDSAVPTNRIRKLRYDRAALAVPGLWPWGSEASVSEAVVVMRVVGRVEAA